MRILGLRISKTGFSRGRGWFFQGFHQLQKVTESTSKIVYKWSQNHAKCGPEAFRKRTSKVYLKKVKTWPKSLPKWGPKNLVFYVFWGSEPQGAPWESQGPTQVANSRPRNIKMTQKVLQNEVPKTEFFYVWGVWTPRCPMGVPRSHPGCQ